MDSNLTAIVEKRIERTVKALRANRFDAHFIPTKEALFAKLDQYLHQGVLCSEGGSMTLFETGIIDYLREGDFDFLDRYAQGVDVHDIFHKALNCDIYFTSSNAVTEAGELYNMDKTGNRVAALSYGPKKVVVVVGYNKIVADIDEARQRVRRIAAPANATRLDFGTPCIQTGTCVDCKVDGHLCSMELVCRYQSMADRIAVLILPEQYGY